MNAVASSIKEVSLSSSAVSIFSCLPFMVLEEQQISAHSQWQHMVAKECLVLLSNLYYS